MSLKVIVNGMAVRREFGLKWCPLLPIANNSINQTEEGFPNYECQEPMRTGDRALTAP